MAAPAMAAPAAAAGAVLLRALDENGGGPFTSTALWPPLDEHGTPKPVLLALLLVLSTFMYKQFYGGKGGALKREVQSKKKGMRVAQTMSILVSQQSEFELDKEQAAQLREVDVSRPSIYHGREDLTVKADVRMPMRLDFTAYEERLDEELGGTANPGVPPALPLNRCLSDSTGGVMEMPLKSRKLAGIEVGGELLKPGTVAELDEILERMTDADYPVRVSLESAPPEASRLVWLLVDRSYQEKVTEQQGQFSEAERARLFLLEKLLHKRVREEMEEAILRTLQARGMKGAAPVLPGEEKLLAPFQNGEKLKEIIKLVEGDRFTSGAALFFPELVPASLLSRAKEAQHCVEASRQSSLSMLWGLLAPSLSWWFLGVVLHSSLEVVVAQLNTGAFAAKLLQLVEDRKIDEYGVRILTLQWLAGWFVIKVWGWFSASLLQGRAARTFGQAVRRDALKALLRQDFSFFDKNSGSALHGRLNGDTDALNHYLLRMSKEMITESVAILANLGLVYVMAPFDLFLVALLPLPFVTAGQMYLVSLMRKWDRQAHFMREDAEANIGQVLGEFKTVRDFSMESEETDKFDKGARFMAAVEEGHQAKRDILGHMMHQLHLLGEGLTFIMGARKVMDGELKGSELILISSMLSGMVGGKIRGMIDRIRDLTQAMEPAGRIGELLQQMPSIEPMSADHCVVVRDAGSKDAIFAALSEGGQVERALPCVDVEGADVRLGAKLMALLVHGEAAVTVTPEQQAVWESSPAHGERVPYYDSPDFQSKAAKRSGLKKGHTVHGRQVSETWVRVDEGLYLPISMDGMRVLRLTAAGKSNLQTFLKAAPAGSCYPLKLYFSRLVAPTRFKGHIEFQNVEFRYPTEQRIPALRDVSFSIEAGKMAALVGHAGCGKSTIFKLIKRLYDPSAGCILLDGLPLPEYDVHHLRRKIAIVAQENILFNVTLRENVCYGVTPRPSDEAVREALKQASALEFVEAFPDNIYTMVGGRGLTLSGGQRQRVAIARAMIRQPQILILDEATSALDPANEKIVQAALDALIKNTGATALIIAHRLTTVKDCDQILVFDEGRMVETGTHDELLKIPVERHAPRGKQQTGSIKTGFYHSQWDHMMGEKKKEDESIGSSADQDSDAEMTRLKEDVARLQREVKLERRWAREKERQAEGALVGAPQALPTLLSGIGLGAELDLSTIHERLPSADGVDVDSILGGGLSGGRPYVFPGYCSAPAPLSLSRVTTV